MNERLAVGQGGRWRLHTRAPLAFLVSLLLPAAGAAQAPPAPSPAAAPKAAAKAPATPRLLTVRSETSPKGQILRFEGEGKLDGSVSRKAAPLRLVVTFPGVADAVGKKTIAAGGPLVRRISVAAAGSAGKPATRVVLYLESDAAHEVVREGMGFAIALAVRSSGIAPAAGARPEAGAAPSPSAAATGPKVSLVEAIRTTLESAPDIRLARQKVLSNRGFLQQATGQFDSAAVFNPSFQRGLGVLIGGALRQEVNRREAFRLTSDLLKQLAHDIEQDLYNNQGRVFEGCKGLPEIIVNGIQVCVGFQLDTSQFRAQTDLLNALATFGGSEFQQIQSRRDDFYQGLMFDLLNNPSTGIQTVVIPKLDQSLENLGGLPRVDVRDTFALDLEYPISFRDGIVLTPLVMTQGVRDNYQDKPADPGFGGKGTQTRFDSAIGLKIDAPLARGAGTASAAANERAAKLNLDAALETLAQTASQSVLNTVLAYWGLAAAQERLGLLERSAASQRRISELSEVLVAADEIPRTEMDRIRARTADADTAAAKGRQALVGARLTLAKAMGATVTDLDGAPLAADPLPESAGVPALDKTPLHELESIAVGRRADLKAALRRRDSSETLLTAARIDMRPRFDVSLQAGYTGIYEDVFRSALSVTGLWKSFTGRFAGPSVILNAKLELPIGNNLYRGRYVQAGSVRDQADISARNLERTIKSRAVEVSASVRKAAQEVGARKDSVDQNDQTVRSSFEQFRAGELSLIDAILTEQNRTQAALDFVAARQTFAARVAELRFETGSLLRYSTRGGDVAFEEAAPTGLSFAQQP